VTVTTSSSVSASASAGLPRAFDGASFDRDGVIEVERTLASVANSGWDVLDIVVDDNAIAVHAFLEMRFKKNAPPGFPLGAFKAAKLKTRFCGFYKLRDGKNFASFRSSASTSRTEALNRRSRPTWRDAID
jgi:hypothetical protein